MTYSDPTAGPNYSPPSYDSPAYQPPAYQPPARPAPPAPRQPTPQQSSPAQHGQPSPAQYGQPPAQYGQPPAPPGHYGQPAPLPGRPGQYGEPPAQPGQAGQYGQPAAQNGAPAMPYQNWTGQGASGDFAQRQINRAENAAQGKRDITVGVIWFAVGAIITLATMASDASVFIVAWGPMLYGTYRIIKGVITVRRVN
ncbi:hypothetical protein [Actinoplanes sp. NPDC020271]|uniref:hypothetical protein n=1 Tax=Actinoplanes sp. NPDC020271 TaxID=3363896 RepID=UPI00378D54C3